MRLPEQKLYDRFRENMPKHATVPYRIQRIENLLEAGIPDVIVDAAPGLTTYVENKAVETAPMRSRTPLLGAAKGLNVGQRNWHMVAHTLGLRHFFLVGIGSTTNLLLPGRLFDELNAMPFDDMIRAAVAVRWEGIASVLTLPELRMEKQNEK